jgi:TolB-like protein/Tfp pilus assembly protein PilF
MGFIEELKRRNVFKVGIAYAVTTWILMQLVDVVSEILALPEWAPKLILLMLVVGFIPALILAWAFELTPEGIKLEKDVQRKESITPKTGRKLDLTIIALLGLTLAYFIWESRFEQKIADFEASTTAISSEENVSEASSPGTGDLSPEVDENSIAVLPFANRSADAGDVYFTDGIHDDLLTQLSKIDALSVISRTSVMEYRDTTKNLREIARELRVANVMEGSVQRAGDRVRINVQLIDANSDEHLWAETYDRELTTANLFDIQSEIAQAIAEALKATFTDSELARVEIVPTDNVAAYDLYLQARRIEPSGTRVTSQTALELYKEALLLDPDFTLAWIGLASSHMSNYWNYGGDPADRELARKAIDRAKNINKDLGELYMAEGFYWYWGYLDYERALYNIEKAIELMPGNDDAYMWRGYISRRMGFWDQAIVSMHEALKLNPRIAFNWVEFGWTYHYLHRYVEARAKYQQALAIDPDLFWAKSNLALLEIQESGNVKAAVQLTIGAQHSAEFDHVEVFMVTRTVDRRFEEVLEVARKLPDQMEIQHGVIMLREMWSARILYYMGREDEASAAAEAAQFRLQGLRVKLGDDYRIDLADAQIDAIKGADPETLRNLVQKSVASRPEDKVAEVGFKLDIARIFAMAGMTAETIELLDPLFTPPSETSVYTIGLDPAFDGIREDPEFAAMMERHR